MLLNSFIKQLDVALSHLGKQESRTVYQCNRSRSQVSKSISAESSYQKYPNNRSKSIRWLIVLVNYAADDVTTVASTRCT